MNPAPADAPMPEQAPDTQATTRAALALTLATTTDTLAQAQARHQAAAESLAQHEAWVQFQRALQIVQALQPQIPRLAGYDEWRAASEALEAATTAHQAALEAWRA